LFNSIIISLKNGGSMSCESPKEASFESGRERRGEENGFTEEELPQDGFVSVRHEGED
jgi:hypothetical protein